MVRGKFVVNQINQSYYLSAGQSVAGQTTLVLNAVCNDGTPENERFHKYTPSGRIEMTVDNPLAVAYLKPGCAFYVDFTAVDESKA